MTSATTETVHWCLWRELHITRAITSHMSEYSWPPVLQKLILNWWPLSFSPCFSFRLGWVYCEFHSHCRTFRHHADSHHWRTANVGGGGSIFSRLWGFWENVLTIRSMPAPSFLLVEISSYALIPLFMPGSVHSRSASWDDCGRMFPDKFCVSSFLDRFPHYAWTAA